MAKDKITTKDRKKATNDMGPTRVSEDSCEEQAGLDASEGENRTRGQGNGNTTLRQRHRAPKPRVPDLVAAQGNPSISGERSLEQRQEDSFLSEIGNDIWSLARAIPRLLRTSYPVWKRLLLFYGLWLIISHLAAQFVSDITTKMAPMCSVPIIGPRIPFCTWSLEPNDRSFDVSQVATSQEVFTVVMDQVGQNFDLARGMTGNQFTLQHLRIRVDASNLPRKKELAQELAHLIRLTKQTAKWVAIHSALVSD